MGFKTRRDQAAEDTQTVARVRGALEGYLAGSGPAVSVSVAHVLDLLNPRGMWSFDRERRAQRLAAETQPMPADADGDPMTGCRPVSPPGS